MVFSVEKRDIHEIAKQELLKNLDEQSKILRKYDSLVLTDKGYDHYVVGVILYGLEDLFEASDIKNARNIELKGGLEKKVRDRKVVLDMLLVYLPELRRNLIGHEDLPEELLKSIVQVHDFLKGLSDFYTK